MRLTRMKTGPSMLAAASTARAVSHGSDGTMMARLGSRRSHAMSSMEWCVGAEFAIGDARRLADELHVGVGIGDVDLDLFERAGGEEAGRGADEGNLAAIGEPRADADHVLLGDADIDHALGKALLEAGELRRADAVVDDGDDALVALGDVLQRRGECVAAVEPVLDDSPAGALMPVATRSSPGRTAPD